MDGLFSEGKEAVLGGIRRGPGAVWVGGYAVFKERVRGEVLADSPYTR